MRKKDIKKERKRVLVWESQNGGQIQQKQLSFDLCNIALGSTLGLHFQKPATMTLGSERPLTHWRWWNIWIELEHFYTPGLLKFNKKNEQCAILWSLSNCIRLNPQWMISSPGVNCFDQSLHMTLEPQQWSLFNVRFICRHLLSVSS